MLLRELYYLYKTFLQKRLNPEKKRTTQLFFLRNIVRHAYKNNRFYRRFYSQNDFHLSELENLEDIKKIPITDKNLLVENHGSLVDRKEMQKYKIMYTSGTSGKEFSVYLDDEANDYNNCIFIRTLIDQGYNPLKKLGFYWYREEKNSFFNNLGLSRKVIIKYDFSPLKQLHLIERHRLEYLYYFPFKLLELANSFDYKTLKRLKLRKIFCVGEILTDKMKKYLEAKFNCPVSDNYGLTEFNIVAYRKSGENFYSVNWDNVIFELDKTEKENIRKPIITSLSNHYMPLIRYRLDDLVEVSGGKIKRILGRKSDFLNIGKKRIYVGNIVDEMLEFHGIRLFNFKYDDRRLIINIAARSNYKKGTKEAISGKMERKFGLKSVEVKLKKQIEFASRGKLRLLEKI